MNYLVWRENLQVNVTFVQISNPLKIAPSHSVKSEINKNIINFFLKKLVDDKKKLYFVN